LLSATDPRIRAFALAQLELANIPVEILLTLDQALLAGTVTVPPGLAARARAAAVTVEEQHLRPRRRARALLAGVAAMGALLLLRLLWPRRSDSGRFRTAAWVTLLGLAVVVVRIDVDGIDYLPDSLGYALAAVAAAVFARGGQGRIRWVPAAGFGLAGITSALSSIDGLRTSISWIGPLSAAVAILFLPVLIRSL